MSVPREDGRISTSMGGVLAAVLLLSACAQGEATTPDMWGLFLEAFRHPGRLD